MEALEFIIIIAVAPAIMFWYLQNLYAGAGGERGMLALADDPEAARPGARRGSYRIKRRLARRARERREAAPPQAAPERPTFTIIDENARMRRRYRRQDETRYAVKDKAARFKPKTEA